MRSRVPATIAKLAELATPLVTAAWPATTTGLVRVWRGPVVTGDPADALFIGYDGNPAGEFMTTVNAEQQWAGIGNKARDETFSVVCAAVVLSGADDIPTAQVKAYDIFGVVEDLVRADPSLGLGPPAGAAMFRAQVGAPQLFTEPVEQGTQTRLVFLVVVHTRI